MRIVLTGGWGYGNLGDDVILSATIETLQNVFRNCIIDVLTYDLNDSAYHARDRVNLHKSIHAHVDFSASEHIYKKLAKHYGRYSCLLLKNKWRFVNSPLWSNVRNFARFEENVKGIIDRSGLLVVAGGGYFNERWMSIVMTHVIQMKLATRLGVPFCLFGPTIGTFSNRKIRRAIFETLRKAASVAVRDTFSFRELAEERIEAKIIPDIALSSRNPSVITKAKSPDEVVIGVIVNRCGARFQQNLGAALSSYFSHFNGTIKIIMSRRWQGDFVASVAFQEILKGLGQHSEIVIPDIYKLLEDEILHCDLMISENLHGLILAVRNCVPIIAINNNRESAPNFKKLVSFMEQIESTDFIINGETEASKVQFIIENAHANSEEFAYRAKRLSERVREETETFLRDLKPVVASR